MDSKTLDDVIRLHKEGVDPIFVKGYLEAGITSPDDMIKLYKEGVHYNLAIAYAKARFYPNSPDEMIRLHKKKDYPGWSSFYD